MKKLYFSHLWIAVMLLMNFPVFAQLAIPRGKMNFDRDWKFHLGHASDPAKDFNFKVANIFSKTGKAEGTAIDPKFDDKDWRSLDLPHDWAVELPFENSPNFDVMAHGYKPVGGLFPQNSVGWYRKTFTIAKSDSGQRFAIQFDGVFRDAMVWINGFYLGTNQSGYLGVNYDITDYINFDKNNVIVVRVDATQYEGWFYEGAGIYRHVWLHQYNNLNIAQEGVFVYTEVKKNFATIFVETTIQNQTLAKSGCIIETSIFDCDGNRLVKSAAQPLSLALNEKKFVKHQLSLKSPRLWSLEDPYLYRVVSSVRSGNKILDQRTTKFGIRTIEIDAAKGVFLNGKNIKLKGDRKSVV